MGKRAPVVVHVHYAKLYRFEGWIFEYSRTKPFGPWPCKEDYTPRARAGRQFYKMFGRFIALPVEEQDTYLL